MRKNLKIEDRGLKIENGAESARDPQSSILNPPSSPPMWRSLDELANTAEFQEMVQREFPDAASEWDNSSSRRTFLKVMGASLALAGVGGCVKPTTEAIVPYVRQPEELTPGKPLFFASAATFRGYARGILVESHEGRPTKIEGNPDHPSSLGAADAITQGHVLSLYDPDRSQVVTYAGEVSNWNNFVKTISADLELQKPSGGQGVRILTGTVTSPTLAWQINSLLKQYPNARWHQYEPVNNDNEKLGLRQAFGLDEKTFINPVYNFEKAKVIVSLDDNFLMDHPGSVRYAREFSNGRRIRPSQHKTAMNRLYVAESTPSVTGAMADERVRVKPSEILNIARAISGGQGTSEFLKLAVADLEKNRGASLVVAGQSQPPEVHALAAALNSRLGNIGTTVNYIDSVEANPVVQTESLRTLVDDMKAGHVDVLIIIGGNPVFDAPVDFGFEDALNKLSQQLTKRTVHMSLGYDETSFNCQWHLPLAHELEVWSDARGHDGSATIMQPLIAALYQGKSAHVLLSILLGAPNRGGLEIVQDYWKTIVTSGDFEAQWNKWLNDGVVTGSASKTRTVTAASNASNQSAQPAAAGGVEIIFRPDPYLWDGRHANNGWLMVLPRPLTKLTWDNAALVSPKTALNMDLVSQSDTDPHSNSGMVINTRPDVPVVTLSVNGKTVDAPVFVLPGHPDDCVTVHLGFGRTRAGRVGGNREFVAGFNAYSLRTSGAQWFAGGLQVTKTGKEMRLACTQNHAMMQQHERDLVHVLPIGGNPEHSEGGEEGEHLSTAGPRVLKLSLYENHPYPDDVRQGNKWGMVIDQNACIGCHACVAACQAENNIAVVGKEQVSKGREMHWLRIDTYFAGEDANNVDGPYFQPLPCMHCENAPCELVCPVGATVHDSEGVNDMVYNRCVGTRYCSNNCPYKVRHFNFLHYTNEWVTTEVQKMVNNPSVTVRSRGIMEKCSYCVQRINAGRIESKKEFVNGQRALDVIEDGEVMTACQQTCPTQAITFGNLNDKDYPSRITGEKGSQVRRLAEEKGNYTLLEELQTLPRTSYLPRYTNRAKV
jgi:molybdopterin-containing oxidoreductase family iron-sulfur binding subunit